MEVTIVALYFYNQLPQSAMQELESQRFSNLRFF